MNYAIIRRIIGWICLFEAAFLLLPALVALIYRERPGLSFLLTAAICALLGLLLSRGRSKSGVFYTREAQVTVAFSWLILSLLGALPFTISGVIPNYIDAVFETASGFTTTGASIVENVELLPHCMNFWRCFTHWVGGMGVLVFILALMPMTGGYHMSLMRAESPGPVVSKLVPKVRSTAKILYAIYLALTLAEFILLTAGRMPVFDALCTSLATAGTGGFGVKSNSLAGYSPYLQVVTTVFMLLFGINFSFYYLLLQRKAKAAAAMEEVRTYLAIVFGAILCVTLSIYKMYPTIGTSIRTAAFQVSSIITTTGFATTDFNTWPTFARTVLVLLMFVGACAGSTGGGMKVSRVMIYARSIRNEARHMLHPSSVTHVRMDGRVVEHQTLRTINVFLALYFLVFATSVLLLSLDGFDTTTNFTAVAATINNIGPGLELVGPTRNFAHFTSGAKVVLIFDMLAGRLELFPMLLLFVPDTWRKF